MNKLSKILALSLLLVFWVAGSAMATSLSDLKPGTNITINDTIWNSTYSTGSQALNKGGEDNETERTNGGTNTYIGQRWDFEGMFWNSTTNKLTLVAGWDFVNGIHDGKTYEVGDLFAGHWGSPDYAHGKLFVPDWVLDFSRTNGGLQATGGTYKIISGNFNVSNTTDITPLSDPWEYVSQGVEHTSQAYTYVAGKIDDIQGYFQGWNDSDLTGNPYDDNHYYVQISGLEYSDIKNFILHITVDCGNDVGVAQVPEPATMLLLGLGLVGLSGLRKKFKG